MMVALRTFLLGFLFRGGEEVDCPDACDSDDDGRLNLSDAVVTLVFLFRGGATLPPPNGGPGLDLTDDVLGFCR